MTQSVRRWIVAAAAVAAVGSLAATGTEPPASRRVVEVTAQRFQFTPAELHLRAGEPVMLRVTSLDVTHGFFQRELGIDTEIVPGRTTEVPVTPPRAGRYTIICDHYCGVGHGNMRLAVLVE